ncbi:hypothetical protein EBU71_02370 [bacterium]|nr:hypothetical protein [Candidatus Elulimicrobium humile]
MSKKNIKFFANKPWLDKNSTSAPSPTIKTIPEWYKKADRYAKNTDGSFMVDAFNGGEKQLSWKSCPSLLDIMGTGYVLKTPCDIEFYRDVDGIIKHKINDSKYYDFCSFRSEMQDFYNPSGYEKNHFAWFSDWIVSLPKGYSAIYIHPINRFELPFHTVGGIVDNDLVTGSGNMPFFILKDFVGTIPKGTPYMQIIPFQREDWGSEFIEQNFNEINKTRSINAQKFRIPGGGIYKKHVWQPRKYE